MRFLLSSIFLLLGLSGCKSVQPSEGSSTSSSHFQYESGAIIRGDTTQKELALIFTGDEFAEGGEKIRAVLGRAGVPANFFFTGNFYRNPEFFDLINSLRKDGHYLGAHSDQHLLYCDWNRRDSLLVTRDQFEADLRKNYERMEKFGVQKNDALFFLPPFEWYNDSISRWTRAEGLQLINMSSGTLSHADYTTPDMSNYRTSETIYTSILQYEQENHNGLNGFLLLAHIGVGPGREDKFHHRLEELINELKERGYSLRRVDDLLAF